MEKQNMAKINDEKPKEIPIIPMEIENNN